MPVMCSRCTKPIVLDDSNELLKQIVDALKDIFEE